MIQQTIATARHTVTVPMDIDLAFISFTTRMAEWWPSGDSDRTDERDPVIIEPQTGGCLYQGNKDGSMTESGRVRVWEPPHRVVLAWHTDPGKLSELDKGTLNQVEARFIAEGPSMTRVEFEHREFLPEERDKPGEWRWTWKKGMGYIFSMLQNSFKSRSTSMRNPWTVLKSKKSFPKGGTMAKEHEQDSPPLNQRQMSFLKVMARGLRTGSISPSAYAKVKRISVGDGDAEYYTIWNGVGRATQEQLNEMSVDDLMLFAKLGKLTNFNDEQFQVNSRIILSSVNGD